MAVRFCHDPPFNFEGKFYVYFIRHTTPDSTNRSTSLKMIKEIETVEISAEEFQSDEFKPPCKFYYRNAHGNYVYVKLRKRELAQKYVDDIYGSGFFSIRIE